MISFRELFFVLFHEVIMNVICTDDARKSSWNCRSPTASLLYNQTTQCLEHKEHVLLASFGGMVYQLPASP